MIKPGTDAPDFALDDHFGRKIALADLRGRKHAMLVFYPLDFTPTWSREIPALEALLPRLRAADVLPLGVSVDSIYCHANWARSLGGISFPLLADFHPKGAVADAYGLYLSELGITDRATVIIDADGVVRYAASVGPGGERDMDALVAEAEAIAAAYDGELAADEPTAPPLPEGARLFVRNNCGSSRAVLAAFDNLHLGDRLEVVNVSESPAGLAELERLTGKGQAPCLVLGGEPLHESKAIIACLAERCAPS